MASQQSYSDFEGVRVHSYYYFSSLQSPRTLNDLVQSNSSCPSHLPYAPMHDALPFICFSPAAAAAAAGMTI